MSGFDFYNLDAVEQIGVNLFYGWGYNFYRLENQLRADGLTIRAKVGWLLGLARGAVEAAESDYRRAILPPPTREKPRPDAAAAAGAQSLERLSRAIGALEGQIRAQPAPEVDRMTQRYREEAATRQRLLDCDARAAGQAELLRTMLDHKDGAWMIERSAEILDGLKAIETSLRERQAALLVGADSVRYDALTRAAPCNERQVLERRRCAAEITDHAAIKLSVLHHDLRASLGVLYAVRAGRRRL
jgi:hypothetical protein